MGVFSLIVVSLLLASVALAAPVNKRDLVTETVWTTIDVTTTVYGLKRPECTSAGLESSSAKPVVTTTTTTSGCSAPVTSVLSTTKITSTSALPSSTTVVVVASSAESPVPAVTSAPTTTNNAPSQLGGVSTSTTASVSPVLKSTSGDGTCEGAGSGCTGDVTHWDGGLGSCGTTVNTGNDMAIALPVGFMGPLSNSNPYCGRSVTLFNPTSGTTVQATVRDKCAGCTGYSIDCTDVLFKAITDGKGNGRMSGIEWYFN